MKILFYSLPLCFLHFIETLHLRWVLSVEKFLYQNNAVRLMPIKKVQNLQGLCYK